MWAAQLPRHAVLFSTSPKYKVMQSAMLPYATFFFSPKVISCLFSILKPDSKLIEEARNSPFDCFESFNNYLGAQSFADVP